jgi:two-component system, OmpR family, response regulator
MDEIYSLTQRGRDELRGNVTALSAADVEFLVRVDGALSLAQIRATMAGITQDAFDSIVRRMRDKGLLVAEVVDPVAMQMQASLNLLAKPAGEAAADSGVSSLRSSGFFVEIARERVPDRVRKPGEALSAIVVEDEPTLAKFIQSYLAFEGFGVRLASNRSEIVAEFSKLPIPDVVLLDVLLPDADGFDVLLRLRQHKALKNVPVIMLTGKATREAVLKGMAAGADGYVTKPFEAESLMRAVRTVVGLPEPADPDRDQDPWGNRDASFWKG